MSERSLGGGTKGDNARIKGNDSKHFSTVIPIILFLGVICVMFFAIKWLIVFVKTV